MNHKALKLAAIALGLVCTSLANAATTWSAQDYDLYPGDFNGDGITDMLFVAKDPSMPSGIATSSTLNGANTPLAFSQTWSSNYLGIQWYGNAYTVVVGDFDGDGISDILMQRNSSGDSYVLRSHGLIDSISQTIPYNTLGLTWSSDKHKALSGDFNGDGKTDLFLQATDSTDVSAIVFADANGQFTQSPTAQNQFHNNDLGFKWSSQYSVISVGNFGGPVSPTGKPTADLLIQSKPNIVMIDYDVTIPVPVYTPGSFGALFSVGGATPIGSTYIQRWSRVDANGVDWSPAFYNVVVGDFVGNNGIADIILQSKTSSRTSNLITVTSTASGAVFSSATTLASNVVWSAEATRLLAGNFDTTAGYGIYFQAIASSGSNSYANDVSGSSIITTSHDGAQYTNIQPTTAAGRIAGSVNVSNSGAANYSMPIDLPGGINGLMPQLGISYNSAGGPGLLGPNWDLSGISVLRRCAATFAQDGAFDTVSLQFTDRFCLDGSKLHLVAGTQGQDGSQYRLELDNFSLVIAHGVFGNGPQWFEVKRKDGLIYEYGNSPDSRVLHSPTGTAPISWSVNKIRDRSGNYVSFNYATLPPNAGLALVDNIQYTGNSNSSVAPAYTIKFVYTGTVGGVTLPMMYSASVFGANVNLNSILSNIQIKYSNNVIRSYNLGYTLGNGAPGRPLLASVQECGVSTAECLAPTTFNWTFGTAGWSSMQGGAQALSTNANLRMMDMNGDGRDDAVFYDSASSQWMIMWGAQSGLAAAVPTGATSPSSYFGYSAGPTDVDGDGRMDLLINNGGAWYLLRYLASGSFSYTSLGISVPSYLTKFAMADVNGDGYQDLLTTDSSTIYVNLHAADGSASFSASSQALWTSPYGLIQSIKSGTGSSVNRAVDFDGDGRQDLYIQAGSSFYMLYGNGASLIPRFGALNAPIFPIDRNSDNCTDAIFTTWNGAAYQTYSMASNCTQNGFTQGISSAALMTNAVAIDWNGDGVQEPLYYGIDPATSATGWFVQVPILSFGFASKPVSVAMAPSTTQIFAADINGDGLQDIAWIDPSTNSLRYQLHAGGQPELMTTVTDGYGNASTINYQPTSSGQCTTSNDGTRPLLNAGLRRSLTTKLVVCGITSNDGVDGTYTLSHMYTNATDNVQGRGYVGFERHTIVDSRTGIMHREDYYQAFPFTGMTSYSLDSQPNGKKIRELQATTDEVVNGTGLAAIHFPYLRVAKLDSYEVSPGNPMDSAWITRQTATVNSIDSFGNVTDVSTVIIDKDASSPRSGQATTTRVISTINNDTAVVNGINNWCLGRATQVQSTTTLPLPDDTSQTHTQSAVVDPVMCRITQQVNEPYIAALKVTKSYLYDDQDASYVNPKCGNVSKMTVTGMSDSGATELAGRLTSYDYGSACRLPELISDPVGNQTRRTYRYDLGLLATEADANHLQDNVKTSYAYDNFGRMVLETAIDGTSTFIGYIACNVTNAFCGVSDLRLQILTTERDSVGNAVSTGYVYTDGYDRKRFTKNQLADGNLSTVQTSYDSSGRVASQSKPYTSGFNGKTVYDYDLIGRQISARLLNAGGSLVRSSIVSFEGRKVTMTDPRGYATVKVMDVVGQVRKVTDPTVTAPSTSGSTQYDYSFEANGVLKATITDAANNSVTTRSNLSGFKTQTIDPDMGTWNYSYNSLGELTSQVDAKNQTTTYGAYDGLGRPTLRREPEGTTVWQWGTLTDNTTSAKYIGQLRRLCFTPNQTTSDCSQATYSETYGLDLFSRSTTTSIAISGDTTYNFGYAYQANTGFLDRVTYPASMGSPLVVKYEYQYGIETRVADYTTGSAGTVFWQLNATDATNNVIDESLGNGVRVVSGYDPTTGLITSRQSGLGGSNSNQQNLAYLWDASGNLVRRTDNNQAGQHEDFYYDEMNRLNYSQLNGSINLDVTINAIGNIAYKSDVGSYIYPVSGSTSVRPHAVSNAGGGSYSYDSNGNMTLRNGSAISWTSYNMPDTITGNGYSSSFSYSPDHDRFKQVSTYSTGTETTYYVGGLMEKVVLDSGVIAYRHSITVGNNTVVHTRWSNGSASQTFYVTTDSLGSSNTITDQNGAVIVNESFAAYGGRRAANWSSAPLSSDMSAIGNITRRGYTGHEHLDNLGLINMNGRVQDPVLGRFISADPYIDEQFGSQGLNRFSYVGNQPLSKTDPTGFLGEPDSAVIKPIVLEEIKVTAKKIEPWHWVIVTPNMADPILGRWSGPQFVQSLANGLAQALEGEKGQKANNPTAQKEKVKSKTKKPPPSMKNALANKRLRDFIRSIAGPMAKAKLGKNVKNVEKWIVIGMNEGGEYDVRRFGLGGEDTTTIDPRSLDSVEAVAHVHPLPVGIVSGVYQTPYIGDYLPVRNWATPNIMIGGTGDTLIEIGRFFGFYVERDISIEPPSGLQRFPYPTK